ncbi:MAG: right-handed parallel beta-helix repeat-containing protein [Phycisphaeraceae bacterium]|nr:right-handed parallel beta-helix repeat-containing protein [Phycisphaeraceae bacterium]
MRKGIPSAGVALLAALVTETAFANTVVLRVPSEYATVQAAIDAAPPYARVLVAPGTYHEKVVIEGKNLELVSEAGPAFTTLDASTFETGSVIRIAGGATRATIVEGFTIRGGKGSSFFRGPLGGGVAIYGSRPIIRGCIITANHASCGGGIGVSSGSFAEGALIDRCHIHGNTAWGGAYTGGAGIYAWGHYSLAVQDSIVSSNDSNWSDGGALFQQGGATTVHNSRLSSNAGGIGGAVVVWGGPFAIVNSSVVRNMARWDGPGVAGAANAGILVRNVVVHGNSFEGGPPTVHPFKVVSTGFIDAQHSLIEFGWPGEGNLDADPRFVDPDNGDYRLRPDSPCIDAGNNALVPADIQFDLDGNPRFVASVPGMELLVPVVDMGPYEFQGVAEGGDDEISLPPACPADVNADSVVDFHDLLAVLQAFGMTCSGCPQDVDGSGAVGMNDVLELISAWGACPQ